MRAAIFPKGWKFRRRFFPMTGNLREGAAGGGFERGVDRLEERFAGARAVRISLAEAGAEAGDGLVFQPLLQEG